jgi:hypothetical protein
MEMSNSCDKSLLDHLTGLRGGENEDAVQPLYFVRIHKGAAEFCKYYKWKTASGTSDCFWDL